MENSYERLSADINIYDNKRKKSENSQESNGTKETSFDLFQKSLIYIIINFRLQNNENENEFLKNVKIIKMILKKLIIKLLQKKSLEKVNEYTNNINNLIESKSIDKNLSYIIKIYILKICKYKLIKYHKLQKYDWNSVNLAWVYQMDIENSAYNSLPILFISIINNNYKSLLEEFNDIFYIQNGKKITDIKNYSKKDIINIFFDISLNLYLGKFKDKQNYTIPNDYIQFHNIMTKYLNTQSNSLYNEKQKLFLSKIYDSIHLSNKILSNKKIKKSKYLKILYCFKLIFLTLHTENFYSNFLSKNLTNLINNCYLPGGEPNKNININSYYEMKNFFKERKHGFGWSPGAYVCSCGYFYTIGDCAIPVITIECPSCQKKLGGYSHSILKREKHFRVFENENEQSDIIRHWPGAFDDYNKKNYILFEDYAKPIIKEIEECHKGFDNDINYCDFLDQSKIVRNINIITYRLLNLVFYSCLYVSIEFLDINKNENYLFEDYNKNYFDMMMKCWSLLKSLLKNKKINIFIFMNLIYQKFDDCVNNEDICSKYMIEVKERKLFESKINEIVEEVIENYEKFEKDYLKENEKYISLNLDSCEALVEEIEYEKYKNLYLEKFPLIKYFMLDKS